MFQPELLNKHYGNIAQRIIDVTFVLVTASQLVKVVMEFADDYEPGIYKAIVTLLSISIVCQFLAAIFFYYHNEITDDKKKRMRYKVAAVALAAAVIFLHIIVITFDSRLDIKRDIVTSAPVQNV